MPDKEYKRSFTFSEALAGADGSGGITAYEDLSGTIHTVAASGGGAAVIPITVRKSFFQASPVPPVHPGETFTVPKAFGEAAFGQNYNWETLVVHCTLATVSDEVIQFEAPTGIVRLWEVTLEGTTQPDDSGTAGMNVKRLEVDYSTELNGTTARTIAGRLVALRKSATPIRRIRISASGTAAVCPYTPGDTYTYLGINFLVTSSSSRRNVIESNGVVTATIHDYTIDAEV